MLGFEEADSILSLKDVEEKIFSHRKISQRGKECAAVAAALKLQPRFTIYTTC